MRVLVACEDKRQRGEPLGYGEWFAWAERKSKTHTQKRCAKCGLWHIWVAKQDIAVTQTEATQPHD